MTKAKYQNLDLDKLQRDIDSMIKINKKYHTFLDPSFAKGNRTHNVKINLTDKEYDNLVKTCTKMNMKKSEYFRLLMYYHGFTPVVGFDDVLQYDKVVDYLSELVQQLGVNNETLGHVSNNLNQFVHQLNSDVQLHNVDQLVNVLKDLKETVSMSKKLNEQADDITTTIWSSIMGGVNTGMDESKS